MPATRSESCLFIWQPKGGCRNEFLEDVAHSKPLMNRGRIDDGAIAQRRPRLDGEAGWPCGTRRR